MKMIGMVLMAAMLVMVAGCGTMKRNVIDPKTGEVVATEEFSGDLSTAVVYDLKDKIVFDYLDGVDTGIKVEPPSKESPTGTAKVYYFNARMGHLSIPKDCDLSKMNSDALSKMISATSCKDVSLTPSSVNSGTPQK